MAFEDYEMDGQDEEIYGFLLEKMVGGEVCPSLGDIAKEVGGIAAEDVGYRLLGMIPANSDMHEYLIPIMGDISPEEIAFSQMEPKDMEDIGIGPAYT